jgi:hypothetical protein
MRRLCDLVPQTEALVGTVLVDIRCRNSRESFKAYSLSRPSGQQLVFYFVFFTSVAGVAEVFIDYS